MTTWLLRFSVLCQVELIEITFCDFAFKSDLPISIITIVQMFYSAVSNGAI